MGRMWRADILAALKRAPGSSAAEIAQALGISRSSARDKLRRLEDDGAVERVARAEGEGRPTHRFFPTDQADDDLPSAYADLAERLAHTVAERDPSLWSDFAHHYMADLLDGTDPPGNALARMYGRLEAAGALVALVEVTDSVRKLEIHHCPLRRVACERTELCDGELAAFQVALPGHNVSRTEHIASSDDFCVYTVRVNA